MNGRTFAAVLLGIVLVAGAAVLGVTAYNAGVTRRPRPEAAQRRHRAGLGRAGRTSGWGYGWGHGGFGFFGFLGTLFFIFLVFGLIRAVFGGGRGGARRLGRAGLGRTGRPARSRTLERPGPGGPRRAAPSESGHRRATRSEPDLTSELAPDPAPASSKEAGASASLPTMRTP